MVSGAIKMVGTMDCAGCASGCSTVGGTVAVDGKVHIEDGLGELSAAQEGMKLSAFAKYPLSVSNFLRILSRAYAASMILWDPDAEAVYNDVLYGPAISPEE
jgi:hypothetical protein